MPKPLLWLQNLRLLEKRRPKITSAPSDSVLVPATKSQIKVSSLNKEEAEDPPVRHYHILGAEKCYKEEVVEPLVLLYQKLLKQEVQVLRSYETYVREVQTPALLAVRRQRLHQDLGRLVAAKRELLEVILRYTVQLCRVCFFKSPLKDDASVSIDDFVHECQAKLVKDVFPAFNPKTGRLHSLIFISLHRFRRGLEKKHFRFKNMHTMVDGCFYWEEESKGEEAACFVSKSLPALEQLWDTNVESRFEGVRGEVANIKKSLLALYSGAAAEVFSYILDYLLAHNAFPTKKLVQNVFHGWVYQTEVLSYYNLCIAEVRSRLRKFLEEYDPHVNSWD